MTYPLKFHPIYIPKIWGGNKLNSLYGRHVPFENTGESWDITCRDDFMGIVSNGKHKGKTFKEVIESDSSKYLGREISKSHTFPLIIKIIDACEDLSVQVHPGDAYAYENENFSLGKNEAWYILDAPVNAEIIVGLKEGITKDDFLELTKTDDIHKALNYIPVKKGDVINIPHGLIHAITKGITLFEVQQNSNITYRVFDYNRLENNEKRELHLDKALDVIDFAGVISTSKVIPNRVCDGDCIKNHYIKNDYFQLTEYVLSGNLEENNNKDEFILFTLIDGNIKIEYIDGFETLIPGESIFIPAAMKDFNLAGNGILLKTTSVIK